MSRSTEEYRRLAEEEATLAKSAVSNESRAEHYAKAACYMRLAEAEGKIGQVDRIRRRAIGDGLAT